jgi:preprotein translocase subunit SecG
MNNVVLVIHLLLALAMIGVVLLQKSEGGGLGMGGGGGGGSGGMGGFLSGRGSANFLTRVTAVLAGLFMLSSLGLTLLSQQSTERGSIVDDLGTSPVAPIEAPLTPQPLAPPVPQN